VEAIIRRAEEIIAAHANRPDPRAQHRMEQEHISEQQRYECMVMFAAEQLGDALREMMLWETRMAAVIPVAQRRARGNERTVRLQQE
jgi:hypothetical protein